MLTAAIFTTIEFYVIAAVVAAAIVAFMGKRDDPNAARQILLPTTLRHSGADHDDAIELIALDDGNVILRRHGLKGIGSNGAVSLAITVKGFDVMIKERLTPGDGEPADTAEVELDFMGQEHYFINYTSEQADRVAAFTFHNRPSMHVIKKML